MPDFRIRVADFDKKKDLHGIKSYLFCLRVLIQHLTVAMTVAYILFVMPNEWLILVSSL